MTTYEIDASKKALGRTATEIATVLRGKHLATYQPNKMPNITVVVTNLDKAVFTGDKLNNKIYHRHSGYHGGVHSRTLGELWAKQPERVLRHIVYRMLPKNRTRDKIIKNISFK